jgi:hypothetical protein
MRSRPAGTNQSLVDDSHCCQQVPCHCALLEPVAWCSMQPRPMVAVSKPEQHTPAPHANGQCHMHCHLSCNIVISSAQMRLLALSWSSRKATARFCGATCVLTMLPTWALLRRPAPVIRCHTAGYQLNSSMIWTYQHVYVSYRESLCLMVISFSNGPMYPSKVVGHSLQIPCIVSLHSLVAAT